MNRYVFSALVIFLSGCSLPHSVKEGGPLSGKHIDPSAKVLILGIPDGQEPGQPLAIGSGKGLASSLRATLVKHGIAMTLIDSTDLSIGLQSAERDGAAYVLKCTITLWEDNATAWSGNGDKLNIAIDLYDAKSHELVAESTHKRTATGATMVVGTPERFFDEVSQGALGQIYGWK